MGIFSRVRDIVSANINSMLDKAEDPEKVVRLMIREMEDTLVEVKASCAGAMAAKKKVMLALEESHGRALSWGEKAELAINRGREDLAREALLEKRRYRDRVEALENEKTETEAIIDRYQTDITQIEEKLKTAREKQRILVQRHMQVHARKQAQEEIRRFETADILQRFEEFENRIEQMEAEADLVNYGRRPDVGEEFAKMEKEVRDEALEKELEDLKSDLKSRGEKSYMA